MINPPHTHQDLCKFIFFSDRNCIKLKKKLTIFDSIFNRFAGTMIAISGAILFAIPPMQRYYAQRQLRRDREESVIAS